MGINLNNPEEFGWIELLDLVENQINDGVVTEDKKSSDKFDASKFMKTALKAYRAPTEKAGAEGTQERIDFELFISRHISGNTIQEKINSINQFVSSSDKGNNKISTILSHCGVIMVLQKIVEDFNPAAGGFAFEAFMAALLAGRQIIDPEKGSLPIEDVELNVPKGGSGTPASLKLLKPGGVVKGSIKNLIEFFARKNGQPLEYIVAVKHGNKKLAFHSFTISPENFFEWISPKYFDWNKIDNRMKSKAKRLTESEKNNLQEAFEDLDTLEKEVSDIKGATEKFFKYWGFEKSQSPDSLNYGTFLTIPGSAGDKLKIERLRIAVPAEPKLQISKVFAGEHRQHMWFTDEQIRLFNNGTIPKGVDEEVWNNNMNVMYSTLGVRRKHFYEQAVNQWDPTHKLSSRYIDILKRVKEGEPEAEKDTYLSKKKMLNRLVDTGQIARWQELLDGALLKQENIQFKIPQKIITGGTREDTTLYGVITVDKYKVGKILEQYSQQLNELCAPIYAALGDLTDNINKFYLYTRSREKSSAAFRASNNARELSQYTERLTEETE